LGGPKHEALAVLVAVTLGCSHVEMSQPSSWPFTDKPNVAVFTTKSVAAGKDPILFVSHDVHDGAWQFLGSDEPTEGSASLVALSEVVRLDATTGALADLPLGWIAQRESAGAPWRRRAR
jgi:hypothetical protein